MYNKILAPMDGSALAECTIQHVKEIAKNCGSAKIIFLAVVDFAKNAWLWAGNIEMGTGFLSQDIIDGILAEQNRGAESYLAKLADKAKKEGLDVDSVVLEGNPAEAIIDYAGKNGIDLIIMSTHGRSGISRFTLGSVTDKVLRTARAPVIVIPPAGCRDSI